MLSQPKWTTRANVLHSSDIFYTCTNKSGLSSVNFAHFFIRFGQNCEECLQVIRGHKGTSTAFLPWLPTWVLTYVVEELTQISLFQGYSLCYSYSTSSSSALFSQMVAIGGVDKSKKKSPGFPVFSSQAHVPTLVHGCHSLRADETKLWLANQGLVSSARRLWLPLPGDMVVHMRKVLAIAAETAKLVPWTGLKLVLTLCTAALFPQARASVVREEKMFEFRGPRNA